LLPDQPDKISPDTKPKKLPKDEFSALSTYRNHWRAGPKHYDYGNKPGHVCPRRFLLVGRPQIGKTGAFLHLVYLLWRQFGKEVRLPDLEEVEPPDLDEDPDPEPVVINDDDHTHQQEQAKKEQKENMDLYPNFAFMEKEMAFEDQPCKGKYGDPMDKELRSWYLSGDCASDCTDHEHFQKCRHPKAKDSSTAAPQQDTGTAVPNANSTVGAEASGADLGFELEVVAAEHAVGGCGHRSGSLVWVCRARLF
jgi:hypothetical protein